MTAVPEFRELRGRERAMNESRDTGNPAMRASGPPKAPVFSASGAFCPAIGPESAGTCRSRARWSFSERGVPAQAVCPSGQAPPDRLVLGYENEHSCAEAVLVHQAPDLAGGVADGVLADGEEVGQHDRRQARFCCSTVARTRSARSSLALRPPPGARRRSPPSRRAAGSCFCSVFQSAVRVSVSSVSEVQVIPVSAGCDRAPRSKTAVGPGVGPVGPAGLRGAGARCNSIRRERHVR